MIIPDAFTLGTGASRAVCDLRRRCLPCVAFGAVAAELRRPAPAAADVSRDGHARDHRRHCRATRDGRFIPDLTKDSFTVLEDGIAQTIDSFALVHGGRTFNTIEAPPAAPPEGIVLPTTPRRQVDDTSGRVLLIFVDDLHFEPEILAARATTGAGHHEHAAARWAISWRWSRAARPSIEVQPTYDRK